MSISVDDLVSSFSSSHIGQEAMDLAALQAQLSQTLFTQQIPRESYSPYRCNTPTSRTPSSSFSWGQAMDAAHRRQSADEFMRDSDEMEDERMVEDLLVPSSPGGSKTRKPPASDSSLFTSTDPFYIAQLQAMQHNSPPQSVFTQFGRPSQHSPFQNAQQQQQQQQQFQQPRDSFASQSISIDTHSYLVATSAAFER